MTDTSSKNQEDMVIIRPVPSKSADNKQQTCLYDISPEKSTSLTLAERRRNNHIPASLKLCTSASDTASVVVKTWSVEEQRELVTKVIHKLTMDSTTKEEMKEDQDFLNNPMNVKNRMKLLEEEKVISKKHRSTMWKALCQPSTKTEILYGQLLNEHGPYDVMIEKEQTDPAIIRILKAYSVYDGLVGYHSSLAALVTPLLNSNMPENLVFAVFVRLMKAYDMRILYMLNMEGLEVCLQQFKDFFVQTCPQLESHFSKSSIQPSMYATHWFLTLFPMPKVMHLYDLVFLQGAVQTMIRASIFILKKNHDTLLSLDQKQILHFLSQENLFDELTKQDIMSISISNLDLSLQIPQRKVKKRSSPTVPLLKQQLEDVVLSLSKLQKDHATLTQENKVLRMHEMDQEAAQSKLMKRNLVLEKRVKKYKVKLANASTSNLSLENKQEEEDLEDDIQKKSTKRQDQFSSFVASLRDTGDFGALIAGALAPTTTTTEEEDMVEQLQVSTKETQEDDQKKLDSALQNVTSELVAVKLDHFETCQKYQSLVAHCQDLTNQMNTMQESQTALCQKIIYLESELEDVMTERDQIFADQEEVLSMAMVAKKTSAELQLEKMALAKQVETLEATVADLNQEKQAFFMPRDSFTEEVFAAHTILFAPKKENRRHTMQITRQSSQQQEDEYKTKFVESELRCRELEKYLAETKVRLAELESTIGAGAGGTPRGSLQRTASINMNKRHSTASLSMLANRTSSPTSPRERRESIESYASSTTSLTSLNSSHYNTNSKRSSVYSRIWNAFGSPPATPTTTTTNTMMKATSPNMIMCEEPQIL